MASLTNDRWRRVEELFARTAECRPADRQRLLAEWCDGDEALRLEVESLLQSSEAADRASDASSAGLIDTRMVESTGACDVARTDHWIGHTIGAYRLERLIATGGMGAVYLARRVTGDFQQDVAFKLIATRLTAGWVRQRFLFERQTLASLQHPYIARLLDGGITEAGEPYLVMEYIEGQRLDEYCAQTNAPVAEVVKLVLQLCEAVSFVHRNLIVHRDLKPSNVLVTDSGTVKLLDFGAAKLLDPGARPGTELTRMGIRPLTPQYASPEQILGEAVTTSSDIYSLGVILYRLVAGRLPFEDSTLLDAEWIDARLESTPPALSAAMSDMNAVVLKALQPDPKDRYHSVDDLASDLRNLLELRPVAARQGGFVYRTSKLVRRRARTIAAVAAIAVACCVAGIATVREGRVAVVQEARATTGYNEMRHLAKLLLFDFYDQVRQLQGSTEVQHQLVSEALGFLDKLGHDVADDSSLQLDLVDAYTKMGNVLGNPYEENLGDAGKATATLEKAESIAQRVLRQHPNDTLALRRLALARRSLAEVYFISGDTARAIKYSQAAAEELLGLAMQPKADLADVQEAASTFGSLGDVYGLHGSASTGNLRAALEAYEQSLALQQRALSIAPGNVRALRGLAIGQMKIASARSDFAPALAAQDYRDALAMLDRLPLQTKQSAPIMRAVGVIRRQLAQLYVSIGQPKNALPFLESARERNLASLRRDPQNMRTQFDLATNEYDLAEARAAVGDRVRAREAYRDALRTLDGLLERDGSNLVWMGNRSEALFRISEIDWKTGARKQAEQEAREALAVALRIAASPKASGEDFQRAARDFLQIQPPALRNPVKALEFATRAVEVSRGTNATFLIALAQAQRATGDEAGARVTLQKALALLPTTAGQPKTEVRRVAEAMLAGK